jgi:hypothetical protein
MCLPVPLRDGKLKVETNALEAGPFRESRAEFVERAKRHWDARAEHLRERGFVTAEDPTDLTLHSDWLVRYQVRGESYARIGTHTPYPHASTNVDRKTIEFAVKQIAGLLEIPLRPRGKGGATSYQR